MSASRRPARTLLVAASVVAGAALVLASLLVVARAWSAACCDPAGITRGADAGAPMAWPTDLDPGDR